MTITGGGAQSLGARDVAKILHRFGVELQQGEVMFLMRLCSWDDNAQRVSTGALKDFLCCLGPFRNLQKKLNVCWKNNSFSHARLIQQVILSF